MKRKRKNFLSYLLVIVFFFELFSLSYVSYFTYNEFTPKLTGALISILAGEPELEYQSPTPSNNSYTGNNNFVEINVSITEENLDEVKYNWNGDNYTYYNDSLVLMYNFDNVSALGENNTFVVDVSSFGNNGSLVNGNNDEVVANGRFNGAFDFDSEDVTPDYINVGNKLVTGPSISTFAWIYVDSDVYGGIIGQDTGSGSDREWFVGYLNGNELRTRMYNTLGTDFEGNTANDNLALNTWYHIGMVINDETKQMEGYINGVKVSNVSFTGTLESTTNAVVEIGRTYSSDYCFAGMIDEIRLWNRTLSEAEIYQSYVSNLNKHSTTEWYLYVNQSQNATTGLSNSTYTYFTSAKDDLGGETVLGTRTINVGSVPPPVPEFSDYAIALLLLTVVGGFFMMRRKGA